MSYVHFTLGSNQVKKKYSIPNESESTDILSPKISRRNFTSKIHSMISRNSTSNIQNGVRQDAFGNYIEREKEL